MTPPRAPTHEGGLMRYRYAKRSAHLLLLIGLAWFASGHGAVAQTAPIPTPDQSSHGPERSSLRGGWYPWDPYQYREYRHGVPILTGFDVEIERALARIIGVELLLPDVAWQEHLAALAAGTADIAAGATYSNERNTFAYFSKPYRSETDVLILPSGASARYPFRTIEQMLDTFAKQKFRLGVIAGFVYADERVKCLHRGSAQRRHHLANRRRCAEPAQSSLRPDRRFPCRSHRGGHDGLASPRRHSHRGASTAFLG
jgi:Bacterial extracellular solute-binding proteins, family 3